MSAFDWESIPRKVEDINDVPEEFKPLYQEADKGYAFKDPNAIVSSMRNAKKDKQEYVEKLQRLTEENEKFKDIDLDEYFELKERAEQLRHANTENEDLIRHVKQESERNWSERHTKAVQEKDFWRRKMADQFKQNEINKALDSANVTSEGRKILSRLLPQEIDVEFDEGNNPRAVIRDSDTGRPRLNDEVEPMNPFDLVKSYQKDLGWAFSSRMGSGSGANSAGSGSAAGPVNRKPSTWDNAERREYIEEFGRPAYRKLVAEEAEINAKKKFGEGGPFANNAFRQR